MYGGVNNVAANAEQVCFCIECELQLASRAEPGKTAAQKSGEPNSSAPRSLRNYG
jgi:hypothetical protein